MGFKKFKADYQRNLRKHKMLQDRQYEKASLGPKLARDRDIDFGDIENIVA